ncbi:MAG: hypothetical protein ACREV5_01220, partial [Steroidobacter sp.]
MILFNGWSRRLIPCAFMWVAVGAPVGLAFAADSAPTRVFDPPTAAAKQAPTLLGGLDATPALTAVLPRLSEKERADLRKANATAKMLQIGVGRSLPKQYQAIELEQLAWTPAADGGRFATLEFRSTDAAAIRLGVARRSIVKGLT